jgi:hypothetical protein
MMAVEARTDRTNDWVAANPWFWMVLGLLTSLLAYAWVNLWGAEAEWGRLLLIMTALLCASGAIVIRMNSGRRVFLDQIPASSRSLILAGLFLAFGAMVLAAVIWLGASLAQTGLSVHSGRLLLLNFLIMPVVGYIAYLCFQGCRKNRSLGQISETAALLILAGLCAFGCRYALYLDAEHAGQWDTIRLFVTVLAVVAVAAAGFIQLPGRVQRIAISVAILFHFLGILSAVMSAPPTPWVFRQIWARVYRPYLQFMFLNNAYHFYAPEPGPSCFIWFRVEMVNDKDEKLYTWIEYPKIKKDGLPDHPSALNYQRHLAMTDHVQHFETSLPPERVLNAEGKSMQNPLYYWRLMNSDHQPVDLLGKTDASVKTIPVPFHPSISPPQQYKAPNFYAKKMIESFALHAYKEAQTTHPGYKSVSVRVYKVVHIVAPEYMVARGLEPTSPILYQPFYLGKFGVEKFAEDKEAHFQLLDRPKYDDNGKLIQGDPLLYWLLPILPDNPNYDPMALKNSKIRNWAYCHAGEPNWVWDPKEADWREK